MAEAQVLLVDALDYGKVADRAHYVHGGDAETTYGRTVGSFIDGFLGNRPPILEVRTVEDAGSSYVTFTFHFDRFDDGGENRPYPLDLGGHLIHDGSAWKVSRRTYCTVGLLLGYQCDVPAPEIEAREAEVLGPA